MNQSQPNETSIEKFIRDTKELVSKLYAADDIPSIHVIASSLDQKLDDLKSDMANGNSDNSRLQPVKMENERILSVNDSIFRFRQILIPIARDRDVNIQLNLSKTIPEELEGAAETFSKAMENLLLYVLGKMKNGEMIITCLYSESNLIISVSDTGIGTIGQENEETLLYIRNQIEAIGGYFTVTSEDRLGSIYEVKVPFLPPEPPELVPRDDNKRAASWVKLHSENKRLVDVFTLGIESLKSELAELKAAMDNGASDQIKTLTHKMKGFPGGFGLTDIFEILVKVEQLCQSPTCDFDAARKEIKRVEKILSEVKVEIKDLHIDPITSLGDPVRVLVAEDHKANQDIIGYVLDKMGLAYDMVETGVDVLNALERRLYSLLLLDIQIPELNGIETVKRLRKKRRFKNLPVIAVSANVFKDDITKYMKAGCDDFFPKPIIFDALIKKIESHLSIPHS